MHRLGGADDVRRHEFSVRHHPGWLRAGSSTRECARSGPDLLQPNGRRGERLWNCSLQAEDVRQPRRQLRSGIRWLRWNPELRHVPQGRDLRGRRSREPVRLQADHLRGPWRQLRFGVQRLRGHAQLRHLPQGRDLRWRGSREPVRLHADHMRGPWRQLRFGARHLWGNPRLRQLPHGADVRRRRDQESLRRSSVLLAGGFLDRSHQRQQRHCLHSRRKLDGVGNRHLGRSDRGHRETGKHCDRPGRELVRRQFGDGRGRFGECSNGTDVYIVHGSTVNTTLTSGATSSESFSGGSCQTCSVAVDPVHNIAFLSVGIGGVGEFQELNLATNAFSKPISAAFGSSNTTSESLLVDTVRNLVLSPNEAGNFQLLNESTGTVYNSTFMVGAADSPGEDCTTGIAVATDEGTGTLTLVDLTQATFSGTSWSAPNNAQSVPEFQGFSAGTDGIAIVSNSHVGVVAGEFGGTSFGVIVLPSTSGSGTPALADWVEADIPPTPDSAAWAMGADPHTLTTYTSPTNGKPYAIFEDDLGSGTRTYVAVVDLKALLARPRKAGTHYLATPLGASDTCVGTPGAMPPNPAGCIVRFIKV